MVLINSSVHSFHYFERNVPPPARLAFSVCMRASLEVREAVSSDNRLSGNTSDSHHGQASVQKFRVNLLFHGGFILGGSNSPGVVCRRKYEVRIFKENQDYENVK